MISAWSCSGGIPSVAKTLLCWVAMRWMDLLSSSSSFVPLVSFKSPWLTTKCDTVVCGCSCSNWLPCKPIVLFVPMTMIQLFWIIHMHVCAVALLELLAAANTGALPCSGRCVGLRAPKFKETAKIAVACCCQLISWKCPLTNLWMSTNLCMRFCLLLIAYPNNKRKRNATTASKRKQQRLQQCRENCYLSSQGCQSRTSWPSQRLHLIFRCLCEWHKWAGSKGSK